MNDKLKFKEKGKHGEAPYDLDIYTPFTRGECLHRLKVARKSFSRSRINVSSKGDRLIVKAWFWKDPHLSQFEGYFEPYVAGTRVYGDVYRSDNFNTTPAAGAVMLIFTFSLMGIIFSVMAVSDTLIPAAIIAFACFLISLYLVVSVLFPRLNEQNADRLLRWIDEQLNVEEG